MSIVINIDSIDKTSSVVFNSLKIKSRINNNANECSFVIKKYGDKTYVPALNDEVVITESGNKIFGGTITKINSTIGNNKVIRYDIMCIDYAFSLKRRLVTERYENQTVAYIINDLLTNYASGDGFTDTNVSVVQTINSISFNKLTIPQCLDKLVKHLNAFWYVDYDKDIHFFLKNTEPAPFDLTDTSGNYLFDTLELNDDITQIRNKVTVRGGTYQSTTDKTETIISQDNAQDIFPLAYKFATTPVVKINSVAQTVGTEFLDDDASFDCLWSYQQKTIRFTAGNFPVATDTIETIGKIEIPIIVRVPDNASIAEFGVFEYQIKDDTITTTNEALDRATVELSAYANSLNEGGFQTYNDGLRAGMVINIQSDLRGFDTAVLIQSVDIRQRDAQGEKFLYRVTFATLKTLGIIEFLQNQIKDEKIVTDEQEVLLNFYELDDEITMTDSISAPVTTSPPYKWSNDAETTPNRMIWNYFTWS